MNTIKKNLLILLAFIGVITNAQKITVTSPDNNIVITINNDEKLSYSVTYHGQNIVDPSQLGFELKDEQAMTGNFIIVDQSVKSVNETWIPVVKSKHAEIINHYN
ncbi:MAG: glycoside hydrolase family 97 N-terminal domain-containing protein, partial [Bacteroidia bacterium]|nr:glycoside hydrolase family 97 N-terminal domain-containing protein [Bacteroidia bacterium]